MATSTPPRAERDDGAAAAVGAAGFLPVIVRWWWTLLAGTVLAAGVSYAAASAVTPTYEARAKVLVGPINTDVNTIQASTALAQTYAELVNDGEPLTNVGREFGGSVGTVQASADVDTRVVSIRVRNREQGTVADVANALAQELVELAEEDGGVEGEVSILEPAEAPSSAFSPQLGLVVPVAGMAGLLLSLAVVLLLEYLGDSFRGNQDLAEVPGAISLGSVDGGRAAAPGEASPAERLLAVKVAYGDGGGAEVGSRAVLVIGVGPGDDGEVPANVATAASELGRRVLLLDADWRATGATRRFGLATRPGVADALAAGGDLLAALEAARVPVAPRLEVVPVGTRGLTRNLEPEVAEAVVDGLSRIADLVVVASPPVADEAASLVWARAVDAVVVVARPEHTARQDLVDALSGIPLVGGSVLGTVLNVSGTARPVGDAPGRRRRRRGR